VSRVPDDARIESARAEAEFEETRERDQPSPWAHARHVAAAQAEFTPVERGRIRYALGILASAGRP